MPPFYDQSTWLDGFNSRNVFTITNGSSIATEINGETVLLKSLSPYIVTNDITVSVGGNLTVEPGVELIISEAVSIYVYGSLHMNGFSDEPIRIRPASDSFRWGALCFENTDRTSSLSHVIISGASSGNDPVKFKAAVSGYTSTIELDTVRFDNNLNCVFVNEGMVTVSNCLFSDTNKKQHVEVINAGAVVENSEFYNILEGDAVDYNGVHNGVVRNNIVVASYDDAIDIGDGSTNIIISNNKIFDCADKGIKIGERSYNINIVGNIIANSSMGIAVIDSAIVTLDNNTLYNNDRAVAAYHQSSDIPFGGIVVITNTIISQSSTAAITADELSSVKVSYSLADTELLPGTGNVYSNPKFTSPEDNDFSLQPDSPAIDAGDPASDFDLDGSRVDIGALPYSISFIPLVINEINYNSSNEFNPGDWIELYNPNDIPVDISGWIFKDEDDAHIYELPANTIILPNGYLVLCNDATSFHNLFPDVSNYIGSFNYGLSGQGELIRLYDANGALIDRLNYDDAAPWPVEPDGTGCSLALRDSDSDNSLPENWTYSNNYGTPGAVNDWMASVDEIEVPTIFSLGQNYPNPFNPMTTIPFSIPRSGRVTIEIYSILGQHVATILNEYMSAGHHSIVFKADNISSGIYFYFIKADGFNQTKSMLLIK